jgi:RNA polymerase sigma-70 factor (ECF subfamily)
VVGALKRAWESGDLAALVELLDPAVFVTADGGGVVDAALEPVLGRAAVAASLLAVRSRTPRLTFEIVSINGRLGLAARITADKYPPLHLRARQRRMG